MTSFPVRIAIVLLSLGAAACGGDTGPSIPAPPFSQTDLVVGTGTEATNGRLLSVHYTLWLYDPSRAESKGQQIETSAGRAPYPFVLGAGTVIRGWDQGFAGMRVGGRRRLIIPPSLAYGSTGSQGIPPNTSLVFDVELVSVQ